MQEHFCHSSVIWRRVFLLTFYLIFVCIARNCIVRPIICNWHLRSVLVFGRCVVTVGLALHWPWVTDTVVYLPTGSMDEHWAPHQYSTGVLRHLYLLCINPLVNALCYCASMCVRLDQVLVQDIVFPLMCHNDEDEELWENDPIEYIRVKYGLLQQQL